MPRDAHEAAVLAILKEADGRDEVLVDHVVESYLRRFGPDPEARLAALRRLFDALSEDEADDLRRVAGKLRGARI